MPSNASQATKRSALELRKSGLTYQEIAIENLWREWKRIIQTKFKPPRNMRELENRMHLAWNLLAKKKKLLANLTDSSQRRVAALLEAEGGSTKY